MTESFKCETQMLYATRGEDQLGRLVGKPLPGDVCKFHLKAYHTADLAVFTLGKTIVWWCQKTAKGGIPQYTPTWSVTRPFVPFQFIPVVLSHCPSTLDEILAECVRTMSLGETATVFEWTLLPFRPRQAQVGHFKILELESSCKVRDKVEHFRPSRYGTGAVMNTTVYSVLQYWLLHFCRK